MFDIANRSSIHSSCFRNALVIVILPLLFLIALTLGYIGFIPLHVELHTLVIIAFIFVVFVFFVRHNANYAACHMRGSYALMEEKLQNELRANALTIMGKTKSTLLIKDFMEEYYKDIRNDNFARVAPSVFPMLGILGTFIAIAISMPDFTAKDIHALNKEISVLLSGIGTAFYASIYGIALSLIWTYFEKRGSSKVEKNLYNLEKMYDERVWKKPELVKHEHMLRELKDKEVIQTLKETFNIDYIRELNDQHFKHFTSFMSDTSKSFAEITTSMQQISKELRQTLEQFENRQESINAVATIKDNIEGFNENAKNLERVMERFDSTVDHTFEKIDDEIGQIVKKLAAFAHVLSKQNIVIVKTLVKLKESNEKQ